MVVANSGWMQNVNSCLTKKDGNLKSNIDNNKMSAKGILICRDNSHVFQDRTLNLDQAVKIGRSVARTRAAADNAIFNCKVLSRNHALLWYNAGKFYLQDTCSSNGTFVNNQRLSPTGLESAAKEVCSGDIVQFGVDVVESTKKVTHGCIIATLKLYLPDGKEAKASRSMFNMSSVGDVTLEDLYKLNQYVQEANRREKVLHSKLLYLQKLIENTRKATSQSWKALIDEDRLLSRVKTVECQLVVYSKNFTDDKIRNDLLKLEEEKSHYQIAAKEALQRVHQEKLEVTQKLITLESRLNETEEECQSLHEISKHTQVELQQLAAKYTNAQKNLAQFEEKLAKQEQSTTAMIKWEREQKQELMKKVKYLSKIGRELHCKLNENRLDSVKIHKKLTGLKNYMQTFQELNTKLLSDESKDGKNPVEVINAILDILNEMIATNTDNIDDLEQFENPDNIENIFDAEENQIKLHEIDSNQKLFLHSERQSSCEKNEHDNNLDNEGMNFAAYILPPINSRRTLINGRSNIDEYNQDRDSNSGINDDTCSVVSDTDTSSHTSIQDADEKCNIARNMTDNSNIDPVFGHVADEYQVEYIHNLHDQQPRIQHHNELDVNNRFDDDDSSDSADSPNESMSLNIPAKEDHFQQITSNIYNNDLLSKPFVHDETSSQANGTKSKVGEKNTNAKLYKKFCDRLNVIEKKCNDKVNEQNIENNCIIENMVDEQKNEIDSSENRDDVNMKMKKSEDHIMTVEPIVSDSDNCVQYSNTKEFILHLFVSSLESLKSDSNNDDDENDDDNDNVETQEFVKRELDELRNWFIHEPNDIVIEKFRTFYYRAKNDDTKFQKMCEQLVILKEKYSKCQEEKTDIFKKYTMLKTQCDDILNASYSVPIQYFVAIAFAFLWTLFELIF